MLTLTTLTSSLPQLWHAHSHNSGKLTPMTLTCSLSQLWQAPSHNSDMLTLPTLTSLLQMPLWHGRFHNWSAWSHCSDMVTLTSRTIWLHWEQAGMSGSGFASKGETGIAGRSGSGLPRSTLVADNLDSLWAGSKPVAVDLDSLKARWKRRIWICYKLGATWSQWNAHSHLSGNLASLVASW